MNKIFALIGLGALLATPAFACNPWVSPTDVNCVGLVMSVTATASIVPQYYAVTPTGVVTGTIAFNTNGSPGILSGTTWVKLIGGGTFGFSPTTPL